MKILGTSMAMMLGLLLAQGARAGEDCRGGPEKCGRCGCHSACEKYCRVVPATKEILKVVWAVKCEDFCPSMPGLPCHDCDCGRDNCHGGCKEACGETCEKCGGQGCGQCPKVHCVKPECGCPRTRKILEKKEVICKIDCWKCEVVYSCAGCGEGCAAEGYAPAPAPRPAIKAPAAPLPLPPEPAVPKPAKTTG